MNGVRFLDAGSYAVMAVTLILFVVALFLKGLSHDLLLEAGVFLISVKLIMMSYKNAVSAQKTEDDLKMILAILEGHSIAKGMETE